MAKKNQARIEERVPTKNTKRQPRSIKEIAPRNEHQKEYLKAIEDHVITVSSGPAGSGKTYLAVYQALKHHWSKRGFTRIVITRPAVEAGEKLGFLPGDLVDKLDPYMRPIYDALYDLIGVSCAKEKIERGYIEIAPLAFMRGRTFNNCFIILDEAQNATIEQLKMAVTRIGANSKMVVNGDPTQTDLPKGKEVDLLTLEKVLKGVNNVALIKFDVNDIVRDKIVADVVAAFDKYEETHD